MTSNQEMGRIAEQRFAARHGLRAHPNSGATLVYMMDAGSSTLAVEHKWTSAESYRITAAELRKMVAQSGGPGARDVVPVHVVEMSGFPEPIWTLRESDLLAITRGDIDLDLSVSVRANKNDLRRSAADGR